jgi:DNA polymerase III subunit epsilon
LRKIVLDTETTGLSAAKGHRITEIGCLEIIDRKITGNTFQTYLNPERELDEAAARITGLNLDFLSDKPLFSDVVDDFLDFIKGAELIIHNASFDVGFLNAELKRMKHHWGDIEKHTTILDTLAVARKKHPGQRNNLDALCQRYNVDNNHREFHGALLDSEILAEVYLAMTAGQASLTLSAASVDATLSDPKKLHDSFLDTKLDLCVITPSTEELSEHNKFVDILELGEYENSLWSK